VDISLRATHEIVCSWKAPLRARFGTLLIMRDMLLTSRQGNTSHVQTFSKYQLCLGGHHSERYPRFWKFVSIMFDCGTDRERETSQRMPPQFCVCISTRRASVSRRTLSWMMNYASSRSAWEDLPGRSTEMSHVSNASLHDSRRPYSVHESVSNSKVANTGSAGLWQTRVLLQQKDAELAWSL
jgi:hypothetical protein